MEDQAVRAKVREVLQAGKLPNRRPDRSWGGSGDGPLRGMRPTITYDQLEFKIQFAHDGANLGIDKYHVHVRCFAAWEFERRRGGHYRVSRMSVANRVVEAVRDHFPGARPRAPASQDGSARG